MPSEPEALDDIRQRLQQLEDTLRPIAALFLEKPVGSLGGTPPKKPGPGPLDGLSESLLTTEQSLIYNLYLNLLEFMQSQRRTLPGNYMVKTDQGLLGSNLMGPDFFPLLGTPEENDEQSG